MTAQAIHALLVALVALPAFTAEPVPEAPELRALRLEGVSQAIWDATEVRPRGYSRQRWAGVLGSLAWHETRLALYVQSGACSTGPRGKHECDSGRARGLWQQHRAACPRVWELDPGSDEAMREGARCASRLLYAAHHRCRSRAPTPLQGAFAGYAGASCLLRSAASRERTALALAVRMGG